MKLLRTHARKVRGLCAGIAAIAGCGPGPQVKATAEYSPETLQETRLLFVPLAVSDDLGDERTGIVLSGETRSRASDAACRRITETVSDQRIVCLNPRQARSPALSELELLFALDKPIPASVWQSVRAVSGADHALLFRPESVSSSREVSRPLRGSAGALVGTGPVLVTSVLVSAIIGASTIHRGTESNTELSYTVSASLVDMRSGNLLKVGVHSGRDSRTVERNLGFAEAPPAAPILEEIMVDLGEEVLED